MGYPSPGVFSLGLEQGIPLVSVLQMGALDVFDFAFRKGKKPAISRASRARRSCSAAPAGSRSATRCWRAGVDPARSNMSRPAAAVGPGAEQGQGDAALSWEGLRAQWKGQGLDFDYMLRPQFLQAAGQQLRHPQGATSRTRRKKALYGRYLRGWATGLEFGYQNPRAATQIVMRAVPGLASQMKPPVATESMMQLAKVFRGRWDKRQGWGWHDMDAVAVVLRH